MSVHVLKLASHHEAGLASLSWQLVQISFSQAQLVGSVFIVVVVVVVVDSQDLPGLVQQ